MTKAKFSVIGLRLFLFLLAFLAHSSFSSQPVSGHDGESNEAILLRYIHREGEVLHADAMVRESVYTDGIYTHDAEIYESSLSRTLAVYPDGSADLKAEFRTDEWIIGHPGYREWISTEIVELHRAGNGVLTVPESAARPVLRDIPVFPTLPVHPGDSWTAPAEEVHVFRIGGVLFGPYRGGLLASYIYEGDEWDGDFHLARISIDYDMYIPVRSAGEPVRLVSGKSSQILYWDIDGGRPYFKSEEFEFLMLTSDGLSREFIGRGEVKYRSLQALERDSTVKSLRDSLGEEGGIRIEPASDGILLTLLDEGRDDILFEPESSRISALQLQKLDRLASALSVYSDRDILISGHTANFGTEAGRQELSLKRATAVADILFPRGRSGSGKIYIRGLGAEEPRGSDMENRRVEILILD